MISLARCSFTNGFFTKPFKGYAFASLVSLVPSMKSETQNSRIPITVLSGFLGAGKTSYLQNTLKNTGGQKFGLVVNDMATVNVDAKQIRSQNFDSDDGIDTMELQDGCVCCSLAEDLIASVSKLVSLSELKGVRYNHILVECSGIAEPRKIRDLFQQAEDYGYDLLNKVKLDTMLTVVDATVFFDLFGSDSDIRSNRDLAFSRINSKDEDDGFTYIDAPEDRKVTDLLLEQVECADIIVINKCDLLENAKDVELVKKVVTSINPTASVFNCIRGEVPKSLELLGSASGKGAANWGVLDEHRNLVQSADQIHSHNSSKNCDDPKCSDSTHDHSHGHNHGSARITADCSEPGCTDPAHNHDHSHDHSHADTTASSRFGITSFVYRRRRPFHPIRFSTFLQGMGKLSVKGIAELSSFQIPPSSQSDENLVRAQKALLRSKGFVWMATSGKGAYMMSHAGQFLELVVLGRWWADIDRAEWPVGMEDEITADFDRDGGMHGDRRQELVFIGQFGSDGENQRALEDVLDSCLLTDDEMCSYDALYAKGDEALRTHFIQNSMK